MEMKEIESKMKSKATLAPWVIFLCCLAVSWVPSPALGQGAKQLRLCHNSNIDSATDRASHRFAEAVEKKTGGQVKVMIYPRNQLGGNRELLEQVKMGSLDMTLMGLGTMGYIVDEYNFMQLPFAFRSQEHIYKVLDSDIGKEIEKRVADQGFFFLSQKWDRLPRHIAGKRAIATTKDLQGLKIREGTPAFHEGIRIFGASPVKINLNEMYIALQQGIADAVELPLDYVYDYSIHETAKFLSLTYHTYGTQFIAMSKKSFDSLTAEIRRSLLEAAKEAGDFNNQLTWSQEDDYMKKIEKAGVKINKPEHGQFAQALQANIGAVEKKWPACKGLFDKIQSVK
jgi:tripartite ATP-independent transporter DctP family solute receptor